MTKCTAVTKGGKPCKRSAYKYGYCLSHIPEPTEDEVEQVIKTMNLCRELFKMKVNANPWLLRNVSRETYYNEMIGFTQMIGVAGRHIAESRSIIDRCDESDSLSRAFRELASDYARGLLFADDLSIGYRILCETNN
jgi:hypothetical protein